jgi:hypothetical protein
MLFLEETLTQNPDMKIVINFHFFPGVYIEKRDHSDWEEKYVEQFETLISKHSNIALIAGAHTHYGQMYSGTNSEGEAQWAMLLTPGISQLVANNPGFTTLDVGRYAQNIKMHFLDMVHYYIFKTKKFRVTDFASDFGIKEYSPKAVHSLLKTLSTHKIKMISYMRKMIGFPIDMAPIATILYVMLGYIDKTLNSKVFYCSQSGMTTQHYKDCMKD